MPTFPLQVRELSRHFGAFRALSDASFTVNAGEIVGLIGPNGSGKTTLFECVAGLQPATSGRVTFGGADCPPAQRSRHLFFVPDGVRPWSGQSVQWVLRYVAGLYGERDSASAAVVAELSLEPFLHDRLGDLSKGEHRRVMLAIGLLTPQPLLMLDEPFDGLDLRQTRDVMRVLVDHAARGRTLFLSVHQLNDAARVSSRLILLSGGRVVGAGTVDELRAEANVTVGGLDEVFLALT